MSTHGIARNHLKNKSPIKIIIDFNYASLLRNAHHDWSPAAMLAAANRIKECFAMRYAICIVLLSLHCASSISLPPHRADSSHLSTILFHPSTSCSCTLFMTKQEHNITVKITIMITSEAHNRFLSLVLAAIVG